MRRTGIFLPASKPEKRTARTAAAFECDGDLGLETPGGKICTQGPQVGPSAIAGFGEDQRTATAKLLAGDVWCCCNGD